jgi:hypothetical protein
MEGSRTGSDGARARGQVGRRTFDEVKNLIGEGKKPTEAFAAVAERAGPLGSHGGDVLLPHCPYEARRRRRAAAATHELGQEGWSQGQVGR